MKVGDTKMQLCDTAEANAEAESCVCGLLTEPLGFPDNLTGVCADCGAQIQFRPDVPKKPKKICFECFQKTTAGIDHQVMVSRNTLCELQAVLGPQVTMESLQKLIEQQQRRFVKNKPTLS